MATFHFLVALLAGIAVAALERDRNGSTAGWPRCAAGKDVLETP